MLVTGANGAGKTNLLESLHVGTQGFSPRTRADQQLVRFGAPGARVAEFTRQVIRAKMFDNLIANKDPNLGNWLVDPDWHLLLIDHSRSFTSMKTMVHKMDNIDGPLWEKFKALDEASLKQAVGPWMGGGELRAILERRDRMQQEIDKLLKARGESAILK